MHHVRFQHGIAGRVHAFHFIIYDAFVRQFVGRVVQFIMPAFLHDDFRVRRHARIENGVEIHVHQVVEVLIVLAGYRVHGLVRIRHSVEERVQRTFYEFNEWLFKREFTGTAEHGMFRNVRHTGAILRRRAERHGEHLVGVRCIDIKQASARFFMVQQVNRAVYFVYDFLALNAKAAVYFI